MFFQIKPRKLLTHSCCVVTKGHAYLANLSVNAQKAQKVKFFSRSFFINLTITDAFTLPKEILIETLPISGCWLFLKK